MAVYGVVNQKGVDRFLGDFIRRCDWGGDIHNKLTTQFPFFFEEKPDFIGRDKAIKFLKIMDFYLILNDQQIDFYEENELPKLLQNSFELLANEFKYRSSHDWRRSSESLIEMLLELNVKEEANDFPLTKALLLDYEAINYSPFAKPVFKMQTAREGMKSFKGVKQ